ncbi:MAG: hypothetical protein KKD69_06495 [Euryarchaeota archaeon]|nr:hypothetical protein [Euryarchaeota archaeon]
MKKEDTNVKTEINDGGVEMERIPNGLCPKEHSDEEVKMVTREQAFTIATSCLSSHPAPYLMVGISKVFTYEEINFRSPTMYNFPPDKIKNYWIAYIEGPRKFALCSSNIVMISKENGSVDYVGSANDEG